MKYLHLMLLFFGVVLITHSQKPHFTIGLDILGPVGIMSVQYSLHTSEQLEFTAGAGIAGYYGGAKYFLKEPRNKKWYTGAYYTRFQRVYDLYDFDILSGFDYVLAQGLYVPFGFEIEKEKGRATNFELGLRLFNPKVVGLYSPIYPCIRFQKNF